MNIKAFIPVSLAFAVSACQSTVGGTPYAATLATLTADSASFTATPEPDLPGGSASYTGVANIVFDSSPTIATAAALGLLQLNVDFAGDTLTGSVTDFAYYDETPVAGSLSITGGVLTGNNGVSIGTGLTADASGTVAGNSMDMDVTGEFLGTSAEMIALWFSGKTDLSGGVALAAR